MSWVLNPYLSGLFFSCHRHFLEVGNPKQGRASLRSTAVRSREGKTTGMRAAGLCGGDELRATMTRSPGSGYHSAEGPCRKLQFSEFPLPPLENRMVLRIS